MAACLPGVQKILTIILNRLLLGTNGLIQRWENIYIAGTYTYYTYYYFIMFIMGNTFVCYRFVRRLYNIYSLGISIPLKWINIRLLEPSLSSNSIRAQFYMVYRAVGYLKNFSPWNVFFTVHPNPSRGVTWGDAKNIHYYANWPPRRLQSERFRIDRDRNLATLNLRVID